VSTPDQDFLTPHRGQSHAHSGPPGTWPGPDSRTAARRCGVQRPFGREAGLPWARRRPAPGSANPQSDQQQPSPVGVDCAPSRGTCPGGKRAIGLQALPVVALGTGRGAVARVRAAVAVVAVAGFRRRSRRLRLGFRWWSGRWHGPRWWRYRLGVVAAEPAGGSTGSGRAGLGRGAGRAGSPGVWLSITGQGDRSAGTWV